MDMNKCKNTVESARNENTKPLKGSFSYILFIVKIVPKNNDICYYTTELFPKWVSIGGNYGKNNEIWIVEPF